jgi:hypothetical protein
MKDERGPWYLLTGLVLGALLGLAYAWFYAPVKYVDASPASLSENDKDHYRALISAAFAANGDLPRARARLNLLNDPDPARVLAVQAQRALAEGRPEQEVSALGLLAVSISEGSIPQNAFPSFASSTPSQVIETASPSPGPPTATIESTLTATPEAGTAGTGAAISPAQQSSVTPTARPLTPTPTLLPTRTATPTPGSPFVLQDKSALCDPQMGEPLIIINTVDAADQPVPGVEVIVTWPEGEDRLFTGLKPELGLGYGDFLMSPSISYTVHLAEGGELIQGLVSNECETRAGVRYWGSWLLIFAQP